MSVTELDITCAPDAGVNVDAVLRSRLFRQWINQFSQTGPNTNLTGVRIKGAFSWGEPKEIKMLQVAVTTLGQNGREVLTAGILRDPTVDILTVLDDGSGPHVAFVRQSRTLAAHDWVLSNPAGIIDSSDASPIAAAIRERGEELRGTDGIKWGPVINLTEAATGSTRPALVSPGMTNEVTWYMAAEGVVTPAQLAELRRQSGGLDIENEKTEPVVVPLEDALITLPQCGLVDGKTLCSVSLYERYLRFRQKQR